MAPISDPHGRERHGRALSAVLSKGGTGPFPALLPSLRGAFYILRDVQGLFAQSEEGQAVPTRKGNCGPHSREGVGDLQRSSQAMQGRFC